MRTITEQIVLWAGKFPVRFNALNAAVKWHLRMPLDSVKTVNIEDTAGLIAYTVRFDGVGDLGDLWIRELPDERFTALIIMAPKSPRDRPRKAEEEAQIASQPDREKKLALMKKFAAASDAQCDEVLEHQGLVLNSLVQRLLDDPEIASALIASSEHKSVTLNLSQIFKGYEQIPQTVIRDKDIAALNSLDDANLRERIATLILGADPVVLQRESKKPHTCSEIADMEVEINLQGQRFYLCIPVKSAREIKSTTVPELWSYQILRPFLHLSRCGVVFISAKKCSQPLSNFIKRMKAQLGWAVEVIEAEELAKLLKINSLL